MAVGVQNETHGCWWYHALPPHIIASQPWLDIDSKKAQLSLIMYMLYTYHLSPRYALPLLTYSPTCTLHNAIVVSFGCSARSACSVKLREICGQRYWDDPWCDEINLPADITLRIYDWMVDKRIYLQYQCVGNALLDNGGYGNDWRIGTSHITLCFTAKEISNCNGSGRIRSVSRLSKVWESFQRQWWKKRMLAWISSGMLR